MLEAIFGEMEYFMNMKLVEHDKFFVVFLKTGLLRRAVNDCIRALNAIILILNIMLSYFLKAGTKTGHFFLWHDILKDMEWKHERLIWGFVFHVLDGNCSYLS